jgi:hypothetical protein
MPIRESQPIRHRIWLLLALVLATAGCRTPEVDETTDRPTVTSNWIRTELYFGAVPQPDWDRFLAEVVTPRFPAGFSVFEAKGQWRNQSGQINQVPTRVLLVLHPASTASSGALEEIRREFNARFHHESVLRADTPAKVSF